MSPPCEEIVGDMTLDCEIGEGGGRGVQVEEEAEGGGVGKDSGVGVERKKDVAHRDQLCFGKE